MTDEPVPTSGKKPRYKIDEPVDKDWQDENETPARPDAVTEASKESFPASDAPGWRNGHGGDEAASDTDNSE